MDGSCVSFQNFQLNVGIISPTLPRTNLFTGSSFLICRERQLWVIKIIFEARGAEACSAKMQSEHSRLMPHWKGLGIMLRQIHTASNLGGTSKFCYMVVLMNWMIVPIGPRIPTGLKPPRWLCPCLTNTLLLHHAFTLWCFFLWYCNRTVPQTPADRSICKIEGGESPRMCGGGSKGTIVGWDGMVEACPPSSLLVMAAVRF